MNRLKNETSPYLLQHADNPVDWYPWGEEALQKAKAEDKPILLSVGYSACHWCHVMAHESFEDEETAAMMNEYFINIKVDREERPDIDDIYMRATQLIHRHGGWPMTVFMTPNGRPFHAGTYYPREPRYGMPSFQQVMDAVLDAYQNKREELERSATQISSMLQANELTGMGSKSDLTLRLLDRAAGKLTAQPDRMHGGLHGGSPKFPSPMNLDYLLRYYTHSQDETTLEIVTFALKKMAQGGIYDQIGYGFHRYSVDEKWLVPHFEKMLYDNAQLARVYLHAYQITKDEFFATLCRQILEYVEREMLDDSSGGFYSAQDADSEGEEGKFFVWSRQEFHDALRDVLAENIIHALMAYWDVSDHGNFEGHTILHPTGNIETIAKTYSIDAADFPQYLETARQRLFEVREHRIHPGRDEKMLSAWNGMMLAAYAEAARVFDNDRYREIAVNNANFLLNSLSNPEGWLYRTHKDGDSRLLGYLEDYANVIDGLLELYQTTFEPCWFTEARRLADYVLDHFTATDGTGFFDTSDQHEELVARPRSFQDNATPSGNNLMAHNFIRLYGYTGDGRYEGAAVNILQQLAPAMEQYPSAFGVALFALDLLVRRPIEVAIIGTIEESKAILYGIQHSFRPRVITALAETDQGENAVPELLAHRSRKNGKHTVYVCQNFTCQLPVTTVEEVHSLLEQA